MRRTVAAEEAVDAGGVGRTGAARADVLRIKRNNRSEIIGWNKSTRP
jgi:hypothetical protein